MLKRNCMAQTNTNVILAKRCRICHAPLDHTVLDLGEVAIGDALHDGSAVTRKAPLRLAQCTQCGVLQLQHHLTPESIYNATYPYFSSNIASLSDYASQRADALIEALDLSRQDAVLEIASNDGYLLTPFAQMGIPVLGVEPSERQAVRARAQGIDTRCEFFDQALATKIREQSGCFKLVLAHNVVAHTPNVIDFLKGIRAVLREDGLAIIECHDAEVLIDQVQFDTLYHQHVFYFDAHTLSAVAASTGLHTQSIERISNYGGSLRLTLSPSKHPTPLPQTHSGISVDRLANWATAVAQKTHQLSELIHTLKQSGARIAGYGAAAKGATLLSHCGLDHRHLDYVVDNDPDKVGLFMPGSMIPIKPSAELDASPPDHCLILAWNYADEIKASLTHYQSDGGRFILPHPEPHIE